MAVNKTTKAAKAATPAADKAAAPAKENANAKSAVQRTAPPVEDGTVDIETTRGRVHAFGRVWEKKNEETGKPTYYTVDQPLAKDLLALEDDGKPLFCRYRPKDDAKDDGPVGERVESAERAPEPVMVEPTEVNGEKRLEVGTKEEEAELGLDKLDEGDGAEGDAGGEAGDPPADPDADVVKIG